MQECRATDPAVIFRRVVTDLMETIVQTTRSSRDFPFLRAKRMGLARQTSFGITCSKIRCDIIVLQTAHLVAHKIGTQQEVCPFFQQ